MTNKDDFIARKRFTDPLNCKNILVEFSPKLVQEPIFSREFIEKQRAISRNKKTIVFDLDETLRGWDQQNNEGFLRASLKKLLDELIARNYRLILWSASIRCSVQQTLNKYPDFDQYFDLIITAENYSFPFLSKKEKAYLAKIDPAYFDLLKGIDKHLVDLESGRPYYRPTKNISLFGYTLLIDDDPGVIQEGERFHFKVLRTFPYQYKNPDKKNLLPADLTRAIESDFNKNMARHIINVIEDIPEKDTYYLIED